MLRSDVPCTEHVIMIKNYLSGSNAEHRYSHDITARLVDCASVVEKFMPSCAEKSAEVC